MAMFFTFLTFFKNSMMAYPECSYNIVHCTRSLTFLMWTLPIVFFLFIGHTSQLDEATEYPPLFEDALGTFFENLEFSKRNSRIEQFGLNEFDFIIVGAGSAGSVVASRLSEETKWSVLLIEAGGEEQFIMDVPLLANMLQFTDANWKYKTMPSNNYCLGFVNRQCNFPRGKVMGGSSVLNYMIYTRGNRRDYDAWADAGNFGWNSDIVHKYFLKSEDANITLQDPDFHQKGGLLSISEIPFKSILAKSFVQAGYEAGYPVRDLNGRSQIGFNFHQLTMKNGLRHSTNVAFIHPVIKRKNLHIRKNSQVTKILFDETGRKAIGVEYYRKKKKYRVLAKKEVIISGGAINSPQLLMLSGIGPKNHLISKGIKVLRDLPVGRNLMDHVALGGLQFIVNDTNTISRDKILGNANIIHDYLKYHNGPITIPGGTEALAFFDLKQPNNADGHPNLELLFINGALGSDETLRKNFGINDTLYNSAFKKIEQKNAYMILPMIMRPKSKGWIELKDQNPFRYPAIYPNYFSDESDLDIIVGGVRISQQLLETNAMKRINATLWDAPILGCKHFKFDSDEYWKCAARHLPFTIYHLSGTCKMGPIGDPTAVVDPNLRVQGFEGLRVIDASIMPEVPAAHTNAPTIMIAEKGSDLIKKSWGIII
ncbi:Glucose-methanol-choline oxidoreductase,Glucose-methanol-choline oxidoreductase, N-terminal,Glucose- [Cinara cedri]|uniref:Glucose-methanol-choline oxidoreductase,Glucose-methanol-choline oxidoreductase, N-terminal,Glucose n=1 Tax=Cinara cedri TaxID=506608 RepID=A0A5E4MMZ8_9HEMI|nr:Glucose-methanol-choline oxidoreductase,Glucose-methanol-choline oxidoreductase, N-terminal,Glucose- [Cinara cedri]